MPKSAAAASSWTSDLLSRGCLWRLLLLLVLLFEAAKKELSNTQKAATHFILSDGVGAAVSPDGGRKPATTATFFPKVLLALLGPPPWGIPCVGVGNTVWKAHTLMETICMLIPLRRIQSLHICILLYSASFFKVLTVFCTSRNLFTTISFRENVILLPASVCDGPFFILFVKSVEEGKSIEETLKLRFGATREENIKL